MELNFEKNNINCQISLLINDLKIGAVDSYKVKSTKELLPLEAIGSADIKESLEGKICHEIFIERVVLRSSASIKDFFSLDNFNITLIKGSTQITFANCKWTEFCESGNPFERVVESIKAVTYQRDEYEIEA